MIRRNERLHSLRIRAIAAIAVGCALMYTFGPVRRSLHADEVVIHLDDPNPTPSAAPQPDQEGSTTASDEITAPDPDPSVMILIPGGKAWIGSDDYDNEKPPHWVEVDAFYIDKFEVTNARFAKFVEATQYVTDAESKGGANADIKKRGTWGRDPDVNWRHPVGPNSTYENRLDHPVTCISYNDALAYCKWAGKRLATEAEWEKAARGTHGRWWPWGKTSPNTQLLCNFLDKRAHQLGMRSPQPGDAEFDDGYGETAPVGSYPKGVSPYGVHDMAGNVFEWVADYFQPGFDLKDAVNPKGPGTGELGGEGFQMRVLKGGSYNSAAWYCRCMTRFPKEDMFGFTEFGIRCAMDAKK